MQKADITALSLTSLLDLDQAADGALAEKISAALLAKLPQRLDVVLADKAGTQALRVRGYQLQLQPTAGKKAELTIYYEVLAPLPQDYTIWLHAIKDGAEKTFDHDPAIPMSAWRIGKIYRDVTLLDVETGVMTSALASGAARKTLAAATPKGDVGVAVGRATVALMQNVLGTFRSWRRL